MKCKHCNHTAPDLPELKTHMRTKHKAQWEQFTRNMATFDSEHIHELSKECPFCPHRKVAKTYGVPGR